jgi:hypothetical protein
VDPGMSIQVAGFGLQVQMRPQTWNPWTEIDSIHARLFRRAKKSGEKNYE